MGGIKKDKKFGSEISQGVSSQKKGYTSLMS